MPSRRRVLAALGAGAAGGLSGCAGTFAGRSPEPDQPPPPTSPDLDPDRHVFGADGDWSSFGCNASNTREVHDGQAPVDGVTERWRVEVPQLQRAAPVVAGDRVYLAGHDATRVLDAGDGTELWRATGVESPPVVRDGVVYASDGGDRAVRALRAEDGSELWSRSVDATPRSPTMYPGGPLVVGAGERVLALDPDTGESRWTRRLFGEVLGRPPVFVGHAVAATTEAGEVALLRLDDGRGLRRWRLPSTPVAPPTADSDAVYVNCRDATTYALGVESAPRGDVDWTVDTGWTPGGLGVAAGLVFAATSGTLRAVDAESGEVQWTHGVGDWRHTAPAVGRDTLFVGGDRLRALDPTPGDGPLSSGPAVRFEREFHGRVGPGPVLDDGTLYVVAKTDEGAFHLLALG